MARLVQGTGATSPRLGALAAATRVERRGHPDLIHRGCQQQSRMARRLLALFLDQGQPNCSMMSSHRDPNWQKLVSQQVVRSIRQSARLA